MGEWGGRFYAEIASAHGGFVDRKTGVFTRRPPGGEWFDDIARRLQRLDGRHRRRGRGSADRDARCLVARSARTAHRGAGPAGLRSAGSPGAAARFRGLHRGSGSRRSWALEAAASGLPGRPRKSAVSSLHGAPHDSADAHPRSYRPGSSTAPRRRRRTTRVDLVGLSREPDPRGAERGRARAEAGEAARQADLAPDLQSRRDEVRGDERHRQAAAGVARRAVLDRPAAGGGRAGLDRRHPQMAAEDSRRPRFRDGLHPRRGPRDLVRVEPGRLHPQLPLLLHRDDAAGPQPRPPARLSAR